MPAESVLSVSVSSSVSSSASLAPCQGSYIHLHGGRLCAQTKKNVGNGQIDAATTQEVSEATNVSHEQQCPKIIAVNFALGWPIFGC